MLITVCQIRDVLNLKMSEISREEELIALGKIMEVLGSSQTVNMLTESKKGAERANLIIDFVKLFQVCNK